MGRSTGSTTFECHWKKYGEFGSVEQISLL